MSTVKVLLFTLCGLLFGILTSAFVLWSFDFANLESSTRAMIMYWVVATTSFGALVGTEL